LSPGALVRLRRRLAGPGGLYVLDHQNAVVLGALAGRNRLSSRVVAVHTTGLWGNRPSLGRPLRTALRCYDAVLALSPGHARYLSEREGVAGDRLRIVPNGIDLSRFPAGDRLRARRSLEIPDDAPVVGTVAMLRPEKNHRLLLEAVSRLVSRFADLRLVLVGDGPLRYELEAEARRLAIADRVRFTGRRTDVPQILPAFDLFALSSHPAVETQPVSVIEALAAGVPVVATAVGDLESMLDGGRSGVVVPAGDVNAFAGALADLLADPGRRASLAERGRVRVREFDLERSAAALEAVLGETR
jgi:glycosyltransferase involved in cell wall biosynthesis